MSSMLTELMLICNTHFDVKVSSVEINSKYLFDLSKSNFEFNPPSRKFYCAHALCCPSNRLYWYSIGSFTLFVLRFIFYLITVSLYRFFGSFHHWFRSCNRQETIKSPWPVNVLVKRDSLNGEIYEIYIFYFETL